MVTVARSAVGTGVVPDTARINFPRMRRQSRERCFAAMRDNDVDVLLLGREANSRYAAGARRLWFSGTRPYAQAVC